MRKITVAENAGFCFGVKRATDRLEEALASRAGGERIFTLGHLIHNETYNESLRRRGVETVDVGAIKGLAEGADAEHPVKVLVRAHGCPRETVALLESCAVKNPHFQWIDCTCPYVKKIHRIAQEHSGEYNNVLPGNVPARCIPDDNPIALKSVGFIPLLRVSFFLSQNFFIIFSLF